MIALALQSRVPSATMPSATMPSATMPSDARQGENQTESASWQRVEHRERHMGTGFAITVYHRDLAVANQAIAAAMARIAELDAVFSDYQPDSEINRFSNGAPHPAPISISRDLHRVLLRSETISSDTDGAFDVTIGPLSKHWRKARRSGRWPKSQSIREAKSLVNFRRLILDHDSPTAQLQRQSMRLDLGGIAKGDALDQAMQVLRRLGCSRALINGGGDIIVGDAPPDAENWRIEVAAAEGDSDRAARTVLRLTNSAVASSGDLWQFIEHNGVRYSHLIDPRTGYGVTTRGVATVVAATAIDADGWASALSVVGPDALERIERNGMAARWIGIAIQSQRETAMVHTTSNWRDLSGAAFSRDK